MSANTNAWRHVIKPADLLGQAPETSAPQAPPTTSIQVHLSIDTGEGSYLGPQADAAAAEARHTHHLSVSNRIDMSDSTATSTDDQMREDFVALVVIQGCVDPNDNRPEAPKVPWDALVLTADRMRQYPVQLYAGSLGSFTGIYPGAVVGIRGCVVKRDMSTMRPCDVAVNRVIYPTIPVPALGPDAQLPDNVTRETRSARIHFAAGPFPAGRDNLLSAAAKAYELAFHRKAQLCVFGGPYIPNPTLGDAAALHQLPTLQDFPGLCAALVQVAERKVAEGAAPCRMVWMPSMDDITCVPVLPQVAPLAFGASQTDFVTVETSNPLEVTIGGALRIGVCNFDAISAMKSIHLQRAVPNDSKVRHYCNAIARTGLYAPVIPGEACVTDVRLLEHLTFGAASAVETPDAVGVPPHLLIYPNASFTTPIAYPVGGRGGPVLLSVSNQAEKKSFSILEVTVADVEKAARHGCSAENGVSVGVLEVASNDLS